MGSNLNIIHRLVFHSIFLEKITCFKYFVCVVGKLAVYGMTPFFMLKLSSHQTTMNQVV